MPDSKGNWILSKSHKALVSDELFAEAQKVLRRKRVSVHYTQKLDLPGRALVRCADCKRVYTPYIQKGIQYFYARCRPGCPNPRKSISAEFITGEIGKCLDRLSFTDDELARIDAGTKPDISALEAERQTKLEQNARRKKKVKRRPLPICEKTNFPCSKPGYMRLKACGKKKTSLRPNRGSLRSPGVNQRCPQRKLSERQKKLSELLKHGSEYYQLCQFARRKTITSIIFSELFFSGKTLAYQCKNGFRVFEHRLSASCGPKEWLSEAIQNDNLINTSISELESFLDVHTRGP